MSPGNRSRSEIGTGPERAVTGHDGGERAVQLGSGGMIEGNGWFGWMGGHDGGEWTVQLGWVGGSL